MPIYAYKCGACGKPHDALQKISDSPLTDCPHCGAAALTKQVTAAGFQLKGSGWYVTDFRNNGQPAAKAGDKPAGESAPGTSAPAPSPAAAPAPAPAPAAPSSTGSTPTQG